jgi:PAT family beta-lactamase induction signal transducer AmpG
MIQNGGKVIPVNLKDTVWLKYLLTADLYFIEGIALSLITIIFPLYLVDHNIPLALITLTLGVASIPYILKFLWGGFVDYCQRFGRKPFILIGGILSMIALPLLSFTDPVTTLLLFGIILLVWRSGEVFIDVSIDAWMIDISRHHERGKIHGIMNLGTALGFAFGSVLLAYLLQYHGITTTLVTAAFITMLALILPLLLKEAKRPVQDNKIPRLLLTEFHKKQTLLIALIAPLFALNIGLLSIFALYQKTELSFNTTLIGTLAATLPLATVPGGLIGGHLADIWGRKKTLLLFLSFLVVFSILLVFVTTWWHSIILYGPVGFTQAACGAVIGALFMDVTNPRVGATQYALLTNIYNIGEWGGGTSSGYLATRLGFHRVFIMAGCVLLPVVLLVFYIKTSFKKKKTVQPTNSFNSCDE